MHNGECSLGETKAAAKIERLRFTLLKVVLAGVREVLHELIGDNGIFAAGEFVLRGFCICCNEAADFIKLNYF